MGSSRLRGRWLGLGVSTAALFLFAQTAHAQTDSRGNGQTDAGPGTTAPETVVTATRIAQPIDRVPAAVTVIDREAIERNGYRSLQDALRTVPGLALVQNGGLGTQTGVLVRGTPASNTLVLRDGVPVNDPGGLGSFDFGVDLLGDVERIEVVRGPGAALYGNNAAGGVINIITRSGDGPPRAYGSAAIGNRDTFEGLAGLSGGQGAFDYNVSVQGLTTDGYNITPARREPNVGEADGFETYSATATAGYDIADVARIDGLVRFREARTEIDDGGADDPNRDNESDQIVWRLGGEAYAFNDVLTSRLDIGQTIYDRSDRDRPDADDPTDTDDRFDSRRSYANFQNTFELGSVGRVEDLTFLGGLELARESIDVESFGSTEETEDELGLYVQGQGTLFDALELTLAGRLSDREGFDQRATYRAGAVYTIDRTGTRLLASAGTAYRVPSLTERFAPFGNPDLDPEKSFSWEVGFEQDFDLAGRTRFLTAGATYFNTRIDDLIDFDFATFTTDNINEAKIEGVESFVTVRPAEWLEAGIDWTWSNTRDVLTDTALGRVPKHKVTLSALAEPVDGWTISPELIYVSDQFDFIYPDGGGFGAEGTNGSYTLVNLATAYRLNERYSLFGRADNLLDRDYEAPNGFRAPGATVLAGVRASY